jgi:hypothetical protein
VGSRETLNLCAGTVDDRVVFAEGRLT